MVAKRKRHKRGGMTLSVATLAGFVPLGGRVLTGFQGNGLYGAADGALSGLTGYSTFDRKWHADILAQNVLPIIAGIFVHKLAGKLGINRALANAGIPFVRI
jgi:hypothetical protein